MKFINCLSALLLLVLGESSSAMVVADHRFAHLGNEIFSPLAGVEGPVQFGMTVDLSANGNRLLVGAPGLDYRIRDPQDLSNIVPNTNAGGVFLYERRQNDDSWQLLWALSGRETEGLGQYISLSEDGILLAMRRRGGAVQVYSYSAGPEAVLVGDEIPGCPNGAVDLSYKWLAMSCPAHDGNTGKVDIYELVNGSSWSFFTSIPGDNPGDRFGWRTALDGASTNSRAFRVAVSAPNAKGNTGYVRVYNVDAGKNRQKIGQDLEGSGPGVQFGFSIAMSSTTYPYVAVGIPSSGETDQGAIQIYAFRNGAWTEPVKFPGPARDERLGRAVAMSANGEKVVAGTARHNDFRGLVEVYERTNDTAFELVDKLVGNSAADWWGYDVALSRSGSILASGSSRKRTQGQSVGSVAVMLDEKPFCSLPLDNDEDPFLERLQCFDRLELVRNKQDCSGLLAFRSGQSLPCSWQDGSEPVTAAAPTASPDASATAAPTPSPNNDTGSSPTVEPLSVMLEGCRCDLMSRCVKGPLAVGEDLGVCISGSRSEVELLGITLMNLVQGAENRVLIDENGKLPEVTTSCSGSSCQVRTPVSEDFFQRSDSLTATGTIVIAFPGRRGLRGAERLLDEAVEGDFAVKVQLKNSDDDKVALEPKVWITILGLVLLVIGACYAALKMRSRMKRKANDDDSSI